MRREVPALKNGLICSAQPEANKVDGGVATGTGNVSQQLAEPGAKVSISNPSGGQNSTTLNIMKTKCLLAPFVMFCAAATLAGCASTERQVTSPSIDEQNLRPVEAISPPVILDESAFRKLDLDTNGIVTFDEWQHFDTSAGAKERFSLLDENGDEVIDATEFRKHMPQHSNRFVFGEADNTNGSIGYVFSQDDDQSGYPGLQIFSIHF